MRELVDGGYLYIAQPPLYKVSRGKSEVYLKDEGELEKYLIQMGLENTTLRMGTWKPTKVAVCTVYAVNRWIQEKIQEMSKGARKP